MVSTRLFLSNHIMTHVPELVFLFDKKIEKKIFLHAQQSDVWGILGFIYCRICLALRMMKGGVLVLALLRRADAVFEYAGYTRMAGKDINGYDIGNKGGVTSPDYCKNQCDNDPACKSFNW